MNRIGDSWHRRHPIPAADAPRITNHRPPETPVTVTDSPIEVMVRLVWSDGVEEHASGWVDAWSREAVSVRARSRGQTYLLWVDPVDVSRASSRD